MFHDWSQCAAGFPGCPTGTEPSGGRADLVVGGQSGNIDFFRNEASGDADPQFVARPSSPMFGINRAAGAIRSVEGTTGEKRYSAPQFVDINQDGLLDLVLGGQNGQVEYYKNIGTKNTIPTDQDALGGVFCKAGVTRLVFTFVIDNVDITESKNEKVTQTGSGAGGVGTLGIALTGSGMTSITIFAYEKKSDGSSNIFHEYESLVVGETTILKNKLRSISMVTVTDENPLDGISIGEFSTPIFFDIDDDGDEDMIVGAANGKLHFFERNGCSPKNVCNSRGACEENDVLGEYPICVCNAADAIGNQCEFCAPGYVESKKIGAASLGHQIDLICKACTSGFWSSLTSFGVSVSDSASAASAVAGNISSACTQCTSGRYGTTFAAKSSSRCKACPQGYHDSAETTGIVERTMCDSCLPGTVQPKEASFTGCSDCVVGKIQVSKAQSVCTDCHTGKYMDVEGQAICLECLPGKIRASTSGPTTACVDCEMGKVQPLKGKTGCDNCNTGTHMDQTGQTACLPCFPGEYNEAVGAVNCKVCIPGKKRGPDDPKNTCLECSLGQYSQVGDSSCQSCPLGWKGDNSRKGFCVSCTPGRFQDGKGETSCLPCFEDTYRMESGGVSKKSCEDCPVGRGTSGNPGQISISNCSCLGTVSYSSGGNSGNDSCLVCPEGALCSSHDGMILEELGTQQGWWRSSNTSEKWHECFVVEVEEEEEENSTALENSTVLENTLENTEEKEENSTENEYFGDCVGHNVPSNDARRSRSLLSNDAGNTEDLSCYPGHTGALCAVCLPGLVRIQGPNTPCLPCIEDKPNNGGKDLEIIVQRSAIGMCILTSGIFFIVTAIYLSLPEEEEEEEKEEEEEVEIKKKEEEEEPTNQHLRKSVIHLAKSDVKGAVGEKVEEEMTGVFEEAAGGTFDDAIEDDEEEQMEQLAQASSVMSPIHRAETFIEEKLGENVAELIHEAEELIHGVSQIVIRQGKVLVGWIQIMSGMTSVFDIPWPEGFANFLVFPPFTIFNIDLSSLVGRINPCLFKFSFATKFVIHFSFLPCAVMLAIAASWLVRGLRILLPDRCGKRFKVSTAKEKVTKIIIVMIFFLYPG